MHLPRVGFLATLAKCDIFYILLTLELERDYLGRGGAVLFSWYFPQKSQLLLSFLTRERGYLMAASHKPCLFLAKQFNGPAPSRTSSCHHLGPYPEKGRTENKIPRWLSVSSPFRLLLGLQGGDRPGKASFVFCTFWNIMDHLFLRRETLSFHIHTNATCLIGTNTLLWFSECMVCVCVWLQMDMGHHVGTVEVKRHLV